MRRLCNSIVRLFAGKRVLSPKLYVWVVVYQTTNYQRHISTINHGTRKGARYVAKIIKEQPDVRKTRIYKIEIVVR